MTDKFSSNKYDLVSLSLILVSNKSLRYIIMYFTMNDVDHPEYYVIIFP